MSLSPPSGPLVELQPSGYPMRGVCAPSTVTLSTGQSAALWSPHPTLRDGRGFGAGLVVCHGYGIDPLTHDSISIVGETAAAWGVTTIAPVLRHAHCDLARADAVAAHSHLVGLTGIDSDAIGALGYSLGGDAAAHLAHLRLVAALSMFYPALSTSAAHYAAGIQAVIAAYYSGATAYAPAAGDPPIYDAHGTTDVTVVPAVSDDLETACAAAGVPLLRVSGAWDHGKYAIRKPWSTGRAETPAQATWYEWLRRLVYRVAS